MVVTASNAVEHGSISRIRQVAPTCVPTSNTWFFDPRESAVKRQLGFSCFAGLAIVKQTDRQTDRPSRYVRYL